MSEHEHEWDTETDDFATYTPDPGLDWPWVIHECCAPRCHALLVTRTIAGARLTFVYEAAAGEETE